MKKTAMALMLSVMSSAAVAAKCDSFNYQSGEVITVNSSVVLGTRIELPSPLANAPMVTNAQHWDVVGDVGTKHIMISPVNKNKGGETTMIFAFTEDGNAFDIRADRVLTTKKNDSCVIVRSKSKMSRAMSYEQPQKNRPTVTTSVKPVIYDVSKDVNKAKANYQAHLQNAAAKKKAVTTTAAVDELYGDKNEGAKGAGSLDESKFVTGYGYKKSPYRTVLTGTFKENMERLVKKNGYKHVMWDTAVENCEWRQDTSYTIPTAVAETPEEAIAFYAKTQDFFPLFSSVDKHVFLNYQGNPSNLVLCGQE
jgi:hypothetical protein